MSTCTHAACAGDPAAESEKAAAEDFDGALLMAPPPHTTAFPQLPQSGAPASEHIHCGHLLPTCAVSVVLLHQKRLSASTNMALFLYCLKVGNPPPIEIGLLHDR